MSTKGKHHPDGPNLYTRYYRQHRLTGDTVSETRHTVCLVCVKEKRCSRWAVFVDGTRIPLDDGASHSGITRKVADSLAASLATQVKEVVYLLEEIISWDAIGERLRESGVIDGGINRYFVDHLAVDSKGNNHRRSIPVIASSYSEAAERLAQEYLLSKERIVEVYDKCGKPEPGNYQKTTSGLQVLPFEDVPIDINVGPITITVDKVKDEVGLRIHSDLFAGLNETVSFCYTGDSEKELCDG